MFGLDEPRGEYDRDTNTFYCNKLATAAPDSS